MEYDERWGMAIAIIWTVVAGMGFIAGVLALCAVPIVAYLMLTRRFGVNWIAATPISIVAFLALLYLATFIPGVRWIAYPLIGVGFALLHALGLR